MNAEQLEDTVMNKDNRILKQITIDDMTKSTRAIKRLMGESVSDRRKFIEEKSKETGK